MRREILDLLVSRQDAKLASVVATNLDTGAQQVIDPFARVDDGGLTLAARRAAQADRSELSHFGGNRVFLTVFNPPLRLILVGAVHIAQSLAELAKTCGYAVTICDPRAGFARTERFPGLDIISAWPDEALNSLALDHRSAVVALTHDPKLDDPALKVALNSTAFYIGALGSRKTHAARLDRLRAAGLSDDQLSRIHGPVGLNIGARTTWEIAISVLAEMTERLRLGARPE